MTQAHPIALMHKPSATRAALRWSAVFAGIALLVHLVTRTGAATLAQNLKSIGWGLLLILALGGISHLLRSSAWRLTFRHETRCLSLARAFGLRLIAEAIGTFGLAGQVVGDSVRVSLLDPVIPMEERIASVALDRAIYIVSSGTVAVTGTVAAVMLLSLSGRWRSYAVGFAATVSIVLMLALFSFAQGWHLFSRLTRTIQRIPVGARWLGGKAAIIESAEESLLTFRSRSPKTFWTVIFLYFFSQMLAVSEVYLLLRFMDVRIPVVGAFVVEALTKLINIIGALNPGNVGTYEGGNLVVARLLGFPTAAGLTLALCRRARILFWAGVGALYLTAWSSGPADTRSNEDTAEDLAKTLARQNERLQLLLNLTRRITSNLELKEVLRAVAANVREAMRCDGAGISLPAAEPGSFRVYAMDFPQGRGFLKEELTVSPDSEAPGRRAFDSLRPVIVTAMDADTFGQGYELVLAEGIRSACFIPLINRGRALGTLTIARATEEPFTSDEVDFLSQAAGQIALAIEEEQAARVAVVEGVSGLLGALRARDEYTEEHSEHVAKLAVEIGRRRGLPPERLEMLRLAALMHDLGKIGIRDDVLLKPEELTPEERVRIEQHPAIAAEILRPMRGASHIADIVLAHHECPDGSGYPRGLQHRQIPLEANILHVADVFCSLTESRSYKEAWSEADALATMQSQAGSKFEAESVHLLEEMLGERQDRAQSQN